MAAIRTAIVAYMFALASADCQVELFTDAFCGSGSGVAWKTLVLATGEGTSQQFVIAEAHDSKSYKVSGTGCGDVELFDDEEDGACNPDNEWWNKNDLNSCSAIQSWDVQDDISGVTIYRQTGQGHGRDALCPETP